MSVSLGNREKKKRGKEGPGVPMFPLRAQHIDLMPFFQTTTTQVAVPSNSAKEWGPSLWETLHI